MNKYAHLAYFLEKTAAWGDKDYGGAAGMGAMVAGPSGALTFPMMVGARGVKQTLLSALLGAGLGAAGGAGGGMLGERLRDKDILDYMPGVDRYKMNI